MPSAMNTTSARFPTASLAASRLMGRGPTGSLPLTPDMLRDEPSGNLFGLTQNAGMGIPPEDVVKDPYLILSTQGGLRDPDGTPVALGYHTGHWEIGLQVRAAALTLRAAGKLPFAAAVSDPCDGRTQGTHGMFDSLPYRNDAALTMRRLIRSLPTRFGVLGIATCDKGLPAMMLALAGCGHIPGVIVPGGVTLPTPDGEDTGKVQSIGARFAHGLIDLETAAAMGCRACGSPGGGCQFLGTAATAQLIAEALGLAPPHSALSPSGEPVWLETAERATRALLAQVKAKRNVHDILSPANFENAMHVFAACGGSTNFLIHLPAIAHAAHGFDGPIPTVDDWIRVNRAVPRLVDALPNGPKNHPTVHVYYAGGVPEIMLHLRDAGLLHLDALTADATPLGDVLAEWESSDRRAAAREALRASGDANPDEVIMAPAAAHAAGLRSTLVFPTGNLAPEGSVCKATSIDPAVIDPETDTYQFRGPARVFTSEAAAIAAIKGRAPEGTAPVKPGDAIVLIGCGPAGTGMEETYQLTAALKYIPWGNQVPILTDARFSGVSTGACLGHIGPEALAGGPIGRLRDGDDIEIHIDRTTLTASLNVLDESVLDRPIHPNAAPHPNLPDDTRLWAALQRTSGGTWRGCVYDADAIIHALG